MRRIGGRPNLDREQVNFFIERKARASYVALAERLGWTRADTYRALLAVGLRHADELTR